jgi:uncharacterized membrane protein YecN with MAPEG domain
MSAPIPIAVPKMLREFTAFREIKNILTTSAIAGTWAAPFALYYAVLSGRIVNIRLKAEQYFGDKLPTVRLHPTSNFPPYHLAQLTTPPQTSTATSLSTPSPNTLGDLDIASRCHGNFLENVPLAFIFLTIAELNGGNRKYLNYATGLLLALRVAHADCGLMLKGKFGSNGVGRPVG